MNLIGLVISHEQACAIVGQCERNIVMVISSMSQSELPVWVVLCIKIGMPLTDCCDIMLSSSS